MIDERSIGTKINILCTLNNMRNAKLLKFSKKYIHPDIKFVIQYISQILKSLLCNAYPCNLFMIQVQY